MPRTLGLTLSVLLLGAVTIAVTMIGIEAWQAARRYLEHRATSASWVVASEPGLLDYEADGLRAQGRFTRELKKLNNDTELLGKRLRKHTRRMARLEGKSGRKRQRAANRSAKSINKSAIFIEKRLALLKALVGDIDRNYSGFIRSIVSEPEIQAAIDLRDTLDTGHEVTMEARSSVAAYRVSVEEIEALNPSRTVRIASGRLARGLKGIEAVFRAHERVLSGLVRDLDRKVEEWRPQSRSGAA
jgi:hypothetical protein